DFFALNITFSHLFLTIFCIFGLIHINKSLLVKLIIFTLCTFLVFLLNGFLFVFCTFLVVFIQELSLVKILIFLLACTFLFNSKFFNLIKPIKLNKYYI